MDLKSGAASKGNFPKGPGLMSLKKISSIDGVESAASQLQKNDFSGKGSYPESKGKLEECIADAEKTQYLFTRGTLKSEMKKFQSDLSKLMYDKSIAATQIRNKVAEAVNKYNKNLQAAKIDYVLSQAQRAASEFNAKKYPSKIYYKYVDNGEGKQVVAHDDRGFALYDHFDYHTIPSSNNLTTLVNQLHSKDGGKDVFGNKMSVNFSFSLLDQINQ